MATLTESIREDMNKLFEEASCDCNDDCTCEECSDDITETSEVDIDENDDAIEEEIETVTEGDDEDEELTESSDVSVEAMSNFLKKLMRAEDTRPGPSYGRIDTPEDRYMANEAKKLGFIEPHKTGGVQVTPKGQQLTSGYNDIDEGIDPKDRWKNDLKNLYSHVFESDAEDGEDDSDEDDKDDEWVKPWEKDN